MREANGIGFIERNQNFVLNFICIDYYKFVCFQDVLNYRLTNIESIDRRCLWVDVAVFELDECNAHVTNDL